MTKIEISTLMTGDFYGITIKSHSIHSIEGVMTVNTTSTIMISFTFVVYTAHNSVTREGNIRWGYAHRTCPPESILESVLDHEFTSGPKP